MTYQSIKDDGYIIARLQQLATEHPREGFWKCHFRIRNSGEVINHKRLHRVYQQLNLPLRRKHKKRFPARVKEPLAVPAHFTHTWSIDFMSDALLGSRKFRTFNVIDDYNREILFVEADYSLKSSRVIWVLRHLIHKYGKPTKIRMDNGPEFIADLAKTWSEASGIEFKYIQPGKPTQNAYIERFNKSYRDGVLNAYLFENLDQVREATAIWVHDYNNFRPHESLQNLSPIAYKEMNRKQLELIMGTFAPAAPPLHLSHDQFQLTKFSK
jgi:putative transposase